jgi:phosphopantothenoylcysteine decarboxylase / phosphopantothenate---cysteine ligase
VADYTPETVATQKIKKKEDSFQISLKKTIDIAATLGAQKQVGQYLVGFALETQNEIENAISKLQRKNFDWIVLNSLQDSGAGFGHDTNKVRIIDRYQKIHEFSLKSKVEVAQDIMAQIAQVWT